jgi:Flp pilus assembly protein TadG
MKTDHTAGTGLLSRIAAFWNDRRGNVAMMFGLAAIPFFAFGGLAVDYSRAMMVKSRLSAALDATALAIAGQAGLTQAQLTTSANAYFKANYPSDEAGTPSALQITFGDRQITVSATATVETLIMGIVGFDSLTVDATAEVKKSSNSLEIAMVLDTTGSMSGSRITDLKAAANDLVNIVIWDDQTQYTSKIAMVPYSAGVNVGTYADAVRGPTTAGKTMTGAAWYTGSVKTMTSATKANPMVVTSNAHGLAEGDTVYVASVAGTGWTGLNNKIYTVNYINANTFRLKLSGATVSSSGYSGSYTASSGKIYKCLVADCGVVVTAASHGFNNGDAVYIAGVAGMTQINNNATNGNENVPWIVANKTSNTFSLTGTASPSYGAYTSGGTVYCTVQGCAYLAFTSAAGTPRVLPISTCVSERIGSNKYTDVAPSTSFIARNYPSASNGCLTQTIVPMTSDKTLLTNRINALTASNSTAGQIGTAWGWYMISPEFAYLWPTASQPKAYGTDELIKIAIIMTDGAYNTPYCNSVIAANAGSGSGSNSDHINCNATNGTPFVQAAALCSAMKAKGIIVYTVGFDLAGEPDALDVLANCATDSAHAFTAANGAALKEAFRAIAIDISNLRLSR